MSHKIYSSYEQIEKDLEILKLERDIHYHKIKLSTERMKDNLSPFGLIKDAISGNKKSGLPSGIMEIASAIIPFVIKKIRKK